LWIKGGDDKLENKELQIAWFSLLSAVIVFAIIYSTKNNS
jgi:hypothetical protein